ncbi:MAG: flagellar assembly protein FliH [Gammaproteobacteria bacterium]
MSGEQTRIVAKDDSLYESWQAPLVEGPITGKLDDAPPKPPTAGEMQALQKQAYDEGFMLGRKEGREKGYAAGYNEGREKIRLLDQLVSQLAEPLRDLDDEVEQNIVALTIQIARHLIRRELKTDPGEVVAVVREALSTLPVAARNPRIYLHPEDAELVRNALSLGDEDNSWRIEEDILMVRGDCRIETDSSHIDASIDARLSAICAQLLGGERNSDGNF